MPLKILTRRSCIVSAKLLRDSLAELTGQRILVTTDAARIRGQFIRYGNDDPVRGDDTSYNSADFISLVSDKARFAEVMAQANIYSPVYHRQDRPQRFPVIIRKTLTGSGGSGIVVCENEEAFNRHWNNAYVWTPFVKTRFELRVHVLGGQVVKIFKKRFTGNQNEEGADDAEEIQEPKYPIRNLQRGYHYSAREIETYAKVAPLVASLRNVLPGSFYTLDVGWDKAKQAYFVFEANSGSGLNSQTVNLYAEYLHNQLHANAAE